MTGHRVVFLPGFMGSRLRLSALGHEEALKRCRENFSRFLPSVALTPCGEGSWPTPRLPICLDYPPCSQYTDPTTVWGSLDMLQWVLDPDRWEAALSVGNGYDRSGDESGALEVGALLNIVVSGRVTSGLSTHDFNTVVDPYGDLLRQLRRQRFDVKTFRYDWRLSCTANATLLAEQISRWWWPRSTPRQVEPEDKVTLIGHSLGGLLGRYYVENDQTDGARYVRRLITIGTPHRGAPEVYTHLKGYTRPFEAPWLIRWFAWAASADGEHALTHMMPAGMQMRLMGRFASALEMVPDYPFVCLSPGRDWQSCTKEPLETTRRNLGYHRPTRRPSWRLIEDFWNGLVAPGHLDCFLEQRDIRYDFVAARTLPTIVAYDLSSNHEIREPAGDGVVPAVSAAMQPEGLRAKHISVEWLNDRDLETDEDELAVGVDPLWGTPTLTAIRVAYQHQDLTKVKKVQEYCVRQVASVPQPRARTFGPVAPFTLGAEARLKQVRSIHEARNRHVISIIRLRISQADLRPILDYTLEQKDGKTYARGLAFVKQDPVYDVVEIDGDRFVHLDTQQASGAGGVLVLPARCSDTVDLLTWNVGRNTPDRKYYCSNQTHAERQFVHWFEAQPEPWRQRVVGVEITNRSSKRATRGPSPCKECCRWLSDFLSHLSPRPEAHISWLQPFRPGEKAPCGDKLEISKSDRDALKTAGWSLGSTPLDGR